MDNKKKNKTEANHHNANRTEIANDLTDCNNTTHNNANNNANNKNKNK